MAVITVLEHEHDLAAMGARRVTTLIEAAIADHGGASVCLTGGGTPEPIYRLLADHTSPWRARIDWSRVELFWGDERHVPPDHPDSNFGMANRALIARVPIPPAHVHRIEGEIPDPRQAAHKYDAQVGDRRFDVLLLGIGEDAHIASIFPGSPLLQGISLPVHGPRAAAVWAEHLHAWRITLTPPILLEAHATVVMAAGLKKADAVHAGLRGSDDVTRYPAQLLRRAGDRVEWLIDRAAARLLAAPPVQ